MNAESKPVLTGGCQCGAIRFALKAAPAKVSICHCRMCQKASGAPFASLADIEHSDFAWTKGKPAAGQTTNDEPIARKRSQDCARSWARCIAASGIAWPNEMVAVLM